METQKTVIESASASINKYLDQPWDMYIEVAPNRRPCQHEDNLYKLAHKIHEEYFRAEYSLWITEFKKEDGFHLYGLVLFDKSIFESYHVFEFRLGWYKVADAIRFNSNLHEKEKRLSMFLGKENFRNFKKSDQPKPKVDDDRQLSLVSEF